MTASALLRVAEGVEGEYAAILDKCRPYQLHGVLPSELLFAFAVFRALGLERILEAGRMYGYSTEVMAHFGAREFVSVELREGTDAAQIAEDALSGLPVELVYGDAREVIPPLLGPDAMVVIDGPKGEDMAEMAVRCIEAGAGAVLCHDAAPEKPSGQALRKAGLSLTGSSDPAWVQRFRYLDTPTWDLYAEKRGRGHTEPYLYRRRKMKDYGPTLAIVTR